MKYYFIKEYYNSYLYISLLRKINNTGSYLNLALFTPNFVCVSFSVFVCPT